jgi:hypothetical protein
MIIREPRKRPSPVRPRIEKVKSRWQRPFVALEWFWEWVAYALSNWTFLEVLEYLGSFSVLVAVIFYFSESGDRIKQRHYQAWQVINTAQGRGGSGGRIEALEELNHDRVPLVGVDVSSAFLQGVHLEHANLLRANFNSADLRNSNMRGCNFTLADLGGTNFRGANLDRADFAGGNLRNADLNGSSLVAANFSAASLDEADLRFADLADIRWQSIKSITRANIAGVRNAPSGFIDWALKKGATNDPNAGN